jgi:hypothetical protein
MAPNFPLVCTIQTLTYTFSMWALPRLLSDEQALVLDLTRGSFVKFVLSADFVAAWMEVIGNPCVVSVCRTLMQEVGGGAVSTTPLANPARQY